MEEKKTVKISLSTLFLILAIIAIIVMGIFIYKLNNDKNVEIQKSTELQSKVNDLNGTVNELQGKIDSISNTINNSNSSKIVQNTTTQQTSSQNNNTNNSTDNVESKIMGTWRADKVVDSRGNDLGLQSQWGSGIRYSNKMEFKENGVFSYMIGITASSDNGSYSVNGNYINFGVPTDIDGVLNWHTVKYIPEENILQEDLSSERKIITYVRAD